MINYKSFLIKKKRTVNLYTQNHLYYFSTIFSSRISYILYLVGISADLTLLLFFLTGVLSSFLVFYDFIILGYVAFRISIILDICDGNLARVNNKFNKYAKGYDKISHFLINNLLLFTINFKVGIFLEFIFLMLAYNLCFMFNFFFQSQELSFKKLDNKINQFIKDLITFEGYLFIFLFLFYFDYQILLKYLNFVFLAVFILLFSIKLKRLLNLKVKL
jgi:phosphatidylglycerophosphate synthase